MLPTVIASRVLRRDRRGSSSPVVVETPGGPHVVKLRGAAHGTAALVAEVIVAAIADRLGLPVPPRRVVSFPEGLPTDDRNDELADLLRASAGDNLGFRHLDAARAVNSDDVARIDPDFASQVRWLDWLVMNPDRCPENPNILVEGGRYWLIDHGASLRFHYDWPSVTEHSPASSLDPLPHVFASRATRMAVWDPILTKRLPREALAAAVDEVPESFLQPLLPPPGGAEASRRRRAAYVAFLWKRLNGRRAFA